MTTKAFAVRNYRAQNDEELDILLGDVIEITQKDKEYSIGKCLYSEKTGRLNNEDVQEITVSDDKWRARAHVMFNHPKNGPIELDLRAGDRIIVKEAVEGDEWWLGELIGHGKVGYFPREFVRLESQGDLDDLEQGSILERITESIEVYKKQTHRIILEMKQKHEEEKHQIWEEICRYKEEDSVRSSQLSREVGDKDAEIKRLRAENASLKVKLAGYTSSEASSTPSLPTGAPPTKRSMGSDSKPTPPKPSWSNPVAKSEANKPADPSRTKELESSLESIEFNEEDFENSATKSPKPVPSSSSDSGRNMDSESQKASDFLEKQQYEERKNFWKKFHN